FLALAGLTASAQQASDFTMTDINGVEHNLQTYLDAGKTVLIDVSATWCGPCWQVHNMHSLENLYMAYGPGGSDEIVVLFVEGDDDTTLQDLQGTGNNTQGDWVTGVPYPIIDNGWDLAVDLDINNNDGIAYPSLYRICTDGSYAQVLNSQMGNINNIVNKLSECNNLTGVTNHAKIESQNLRVCENNGSAAAAASFTNYGTNAITSATFVVKDSENNVVATKAFTGSVAMFASATVTFDDANYATG